MKGKGMQLRSYRPSVVGVLLVAASNSGCSLLFHRDPAQCSKDSDCRGRGSGIAEYVCEQSTCVMKAPDGGTGGGAQGGGGAGTEGGGGGSLSEAGNETGGHFDASVDGSGREDASTDAGSDMPDGPGEAAPPGCSSNADCTPASVTHPEVACDTATGVCVQLTTDDCPFVLGDYSGKRAAPIYLGAFATLPPNSPQSHPSYLNYALAIDEFGLQGIPGWDAKKQSAGLRMPVAVLCNWQADIPRAMTHLTTYLQVPGVVTEFDATTLKTTFLADEASTFFVNPFSANSTLTAMATGTRLWHLLGQPGDHAPTYAAFMPRLEAYVRSFHGLSASEPVRLATITGNATDTQDLADAVMKVLRWNSKSVDENRNAASYLNITVDSVLNGIDASKINLDTAISTLLAFKPHLVVSFGSYEFTKLMQIYDLQNTTGPAPFYLLGPYNMTSDTVRTWVGLGPTAESEARRKRVAGIGTAATSDPHVLNAYTSRFLGKYTSGQSALGQENFYDAMYFAIYALVGAGPLPKLTGRNLAEGMQRLLSGNSYDMGPSDMGKIFGALSSTGTISLFGTLGPPNFALSTGSRVGEGSVYCLNPNDQSGLVSYAYDVLRLVPAADGGTPALTGTFSCYDEM